MQENNESKSYQEFKVIEDGIKRIEEVKKLETEGKTKAVEVMKNWIQSYSITAHELFESEEQPKSKKAPTKKTDFEFVVGATYEKDGNTWAYTGQKGRRPTWVNEAIENGTIDQFKK
ncbi:H-NS family nucleoid-associated regulatory protein [Limnohabitans parvus]|uniref:Histone-like protein H-NS C-terminal domain-containing protein n=1 Tax=Limnohabitans parvus II-B4 TaxID=1293052 RepID=A0A315EB75_9BURK|nr:H-NS family nucleoid-associated regulatory protein [Limnohabitans parvus]PUE55206.1 hypothetical protein B9Z37_01025 [Limnohabitans parvus II-B4]